jgi:hypothetical protein
MIRSSIVFAAALAAIASIAAPASALELGTLRCQGGEGPGYVVGSQRDYDCMFVPRRGGPPHYYHAILRRYGLDVGVTRMERVTWAVLAGTTYVGPGALGGRYVGATASAAVGYGLGANALVGGLNNAFTLQPLSVSAQRGISAVGGVASFEMVPVQPRPSRPSRPPRRR